MNSILIHINLEQDHLSQVGRCSREGKENREQKKGPCLTVTGLEWNRHRIMQWGQSQFGSLQVTMTGSRRERMGRR